MLNMMSVYGLVARAAEKFPQKTALEDSDGKLSYSELASLCDTIAGSLESAGVPKEQPVAVFLPKGRYFAAAQLGILRSGRFYAPLDYSEAGERLEVILKDLDCGLIVTDATGMDILISNGADPEKLAIFKQLASGERSATPADETKPGDPACVMFTSGSTGKPKGVVLTHGSILDFAAFYAETLDIDEGDTIALQAPFHFDAAIIDLYSALYAGARFLVIPEIMQRYPDKLLGYLEENEVTRLFLIPSLMATVAGSGALTPGRLPLVKSVGFGGEAMYNKTLNVFRGAMPDCVFMNLYGPTETTVACTYYIADREFSDSDPLPIGVACPNKGVIILGSDGKEVAEGEKGELCILGAGLAIGYWRSPSLTERDFVQNPLNPVPERMYKSGDIASVAKDGLIMFHGRADDQISINGLRIELGDIENAVSKILTSERVCAVFDEQKKEIVLCVETKEDIQLRRLNMELRGHLPGYMLPKRLETVSEFPQKASGKIDKAALKKGLNIS